MTLVNQYKKSNYMLLPVILLIGLLMAVVGIVGASLPVKGTIFLLGFTSLWFLLKGEDFSYKFIIAYLFFALLSPPLQLAPSIPAIRMDDFLFGILVIHTILQLLRGKLPETLKLASKVQWFFFVFFLFTVISFISSLIFFPELASLRDAFETVKFVKLFLVFNLAVNTFLVHKQKEALIGYFLFVSGLSLFFAFAQYYNIFWVNSWLTPIYAPTQMEGLLKYGRVVGATANPNVFSFPVMMNISLLFAMFFHKKNGFWHLILLAGWVAALTMSLSRTGAVIALGAVMVLFFLYFITQGIKNKRAWQATVLLGAYIAGIFLFSSDVYLDRMKRGTDIKNDKSFQTRVENWDEPIEHTKKSPLVGVGPTKKAEVKRYDNEWLLLLKRYGIVGIGGYLLFLSTLAWTLFKDYRTRQKDNLNYFRMALLAIIAASVVYMIPAAIVHELQLMPILMLLLGLGINNTDRAEER